MANAPYSRSLDDYEFSDSFEIMKSEIIYKKASINDFIIDGEIIVKEKQEKLDKKLNELYQKDEESGRIFEHHDHFQQSSINESLQEAFHLSASVYLYSQFECTLLDIAQKTKELFKSIIVPEK